MGRRNTSFYDDLFLQKTKAIFCQVIENLNVNKEIDYVEALSSRETLERWNDGSHLASDTNEGRSLQTKRKWPVTFEQFVEHLDGQDQFVKDTAELLVSETIRTAIDKSLNDMAFAVYETGAGPPLLRTDVGCMRDDHHSRRVRQGVERLTRSNRRSHHSLIVESDSSNSSSSSESSDLNPEDFLPIGTVPRAPASVLQVRSAAHIPGSLQTERTESDIEEEREMRIAAERAYGVGRQIELNRATRNRLSHEGAGTVPRSTGTTSAPTLLTSNLQGESSTGTLIDRFLNQPLSSTSRIASAQRDSNLPLTSLYSIYGTSREAAPNRSAQVNHVAINADEETGEGSGIRREEFEAFASSRRYNRRSRRSQMDESRSGQQRSTAPNAQAQTASEDETFYRALGTLFQADETIRLVSQEAEEMDSAATTHRRARRFRLPPLSSERRVLRMPARPMTRREGETFP